VQYHCFKCEEKSDYYKHNFYEELGRENIFKPTIGNGSLYQDSDDNGVRTVNFATSKKKS